MSVVRALGPLVAAACLLGGVSGVPARAEDLGSCRLQGSGTLAFGGGGHTAPATGTLRVAVVPVEFPDHAATRDDAAALVEGIAALRPFVRVASAGRLRVAVTVVPGWAPLARERRAYTDDPAASVHWEYVAEALAASESLPSGTDVVLVAAAGVATGYPGGAAILTDVGAGVPAPGGTADLVVTMGLAVADPGRVMVHEVLHTLGLEDLYAREGDEPFPFTGVFGVMGDVAATSPSPTAWERWRLGWIADDRVRCVTGAGAVLRLSEHDRPGTQAAIVPLADGTAIVVERRARRGLDREGPAGVLVTRVDPAIPGGAGPIRVVSTGREPAVVGAGQRVVEAGVRVHVRADGTVRLDRLSR
jgi:M6 family metalloprotease-like protein